MREVFFQLFISEVRMQARQLIVVDGKPFASTPKQASVCEKGTSRPPTVDAVLRCGAW